MSKKFHIGLVGKLIIGLVLGIMLGLWAPAPFNRVVVTASTLFSVFLKFVIPFLIVAFVTMGIADLSQGAGKLLLLTAGMAYISSLVWGTLAFTVSDTIFPRFVSEMAVHSVSDPESGMLKPFFTILLPPVIDVTSAVVLAFILGLCLSSMKGETAVLYSTFRDFSRVISKVLKTAVIPLLPLYICGTFINMTVSGQTFMILSVLWKVFLTVIILHFTCLLVMYFVAGAVSKKNPFTLMRNQIPGYISAMGTQSSAATIPVNLRCAESDGVSPEIRNFVIPLCANIHMAGSMITITCCVTAVLLIYGMPSNLGVIVPFIMTLGIAMVASPGTPGGSIMTALPFLPIVGIASDSTTASLLIALYITQDSFGTACNVSGDNSISVIVDTIYRKFIRGDAPEAEA
ncbi:MAG: dicarboxylate/amino acid:cation symporter [Spirochaetaceae bacterium]|jgi:Na+/H+-dicarboxylate symporter|nr:dicarboxylate/amino acid:cation symporter [Spirochaetaceae bacterium]